MNKNLALAEFAKTLAGVYDNIEQSQKDPKDFARINIFFRPLPWHIFKGPGFYSEQCYDYAPWDPYRQGIHRLTTHKDTFVVENYGFSNPRRLAGAGRDPKIMNAIDSTTLKERCGCAMHFHRREKGHYIGKVEPGKNCLVPRDGKLTYLVSEVEVDQENWISRDRGFDPKTDEQIWGSEHGLLRFKRIQSFSEEINDEWLNSKS